MTRSRFLLPLGMALLLAATALPAQAQRGGDAEVKRLIDQLNPGSATRGIRIPAEPAPGGQAPSGQTPPGQAPSGQARIAAPTGKSAAPGGQMASTAAPADVPTASITVLFPTGSAAVTAQAARSIDPLGRALTSQQLAPYRFRIEGHTDTVGSRESNQALSERRAEAVRSYLIERYGVPPDRLEAVGVGEDQPLVPTPDETAERRNRRVQIVNLGA